jgi:HSP20 family protein
MPNFFQKLTDQNYRAEHDPADPEPTRIEQTAARPVTPHGVNAAKPHRISVDTEPKKSRAEILPEEEQEGELTVDIYDRGDSIIIQSTVAGVRPEDLDVAITSDTITVTGRRECPERVEEGNYFYKELFWGTFSRSVLLPEEIDEDEAEAVLKNGLLTLKLPKKKHGVIQKIKVKLV